jgi:hypothetical protein
MKILALCVTIAIVGIAIVAYGDKIIRYALAQTVNSTSCEISIPNNPCIKQFHATPAMCERAKIINETTPINSTNMTAVIGKSIALMFMKGEGHCLSK